MPIYHKLGNIPHKRHTVFKSEEGAFYYEQLFGTEGFSGMASLLYHIHRPTQIKTIGEPMDYTPKAAKQHNMHPMKLMGMNLPMQSDWVSGRVPLLFNNDVILGLSHLDGKEMPYFYKNADHDELLFIHVGKGVFKSMLGDIPFESGDYIVVPRGVIYQMEWETENNKLLYLESKDPIYTPKRYRNYFGQMGEHAPFCERDYKLPQDLKAHDEKGEFLIKIRREHQVYDFVYATHPFDVVGWDGYNFPYGFSIHDFEPITGRVHQPPPVHQTFETASYVVCSFCPRLYDYHPQAVPAPYNHSNIDSDEVLYYVDGDFMSRNDIAPGVITLHPAGIPHGPQPGAMERSIGKKVTNELAVMVDTFRPFKVTEAAAKIDDGIYYNSWLEK